MNSTPNSAVAAAAAAATAEILIKRQSEVSK